MSEFGDLSLDGGQILSSQKPRSPPHLLLLKVFKVDTLLSISGGQNGGQDDVTILSPVVSLFAKNFNNRFLPLGLNLTMRHLVATDKKKVCEFFFTDFANKHMEQWRICAEKRFLRTLVSSYSKAVRVLSGQRQQ